MLDRYTKIVLTVIAANTTLMVINGLLEKLIPDAWAQTGVYVEGGELSVHVSGGQLDYETDITAGPTLKVCTEC